MAPQGPLYTYPFPSVLLLDTAQVGWGNGEKEWELFAFYYF